MGLGRTVCDVTKGAFYEHRTTSRPKLCQLPASSPKPPSLSLAFSGLASVASQRLRRSTAATQLADVAVADALALPLRPGSMDAALCIAVLHHMSSRARRRELLAALRGTLVPGGRALVTAWATSQPAGKLEKWRPLPGGEANDYLVPWHVPLHRVEAAQAAAAPSAEVDARKSTVKLERYYHLFEQRELEDLVASVPGATLLDSFFDKDNWCVVFS